jgi:hypothetical protein
MPIPETPVTTVKPVGDVGERTRRLGAEHGDPKACGAGDWETKDQRSTIQIERNGACSSATIPRWIPPGVGSGERFRSFPRGAPPLIYLFDP